MTMNSVAELKKATEAREQLTSFLGDVLINSKVREAFKIDPVATAEAAGLVLSDQQKQIMKLIAQDLTDTALKLEDKLSSEGLLLETLCLVKECYILY